ncbi:UNVERIFIED_CONTAM: putative amidohydrolase [Brevibacillus sp. OAP136]
MSHTRGGEKVSKYLNVGVIQMSVSRDKATNLKRIAEKVQSLMDSFQKPECIVGVEGGIGLSSPETIPGPSTDFLCELAKLHGVYLVAGTMLEASDELHEGEYYHSAPVINPNGEIIAVYRKLCPFTPMEASIPGKEYVVFEIPEKQAKVGVMIGYDMSFPEVSRNLTLSGAEVLIRLASDIDPLFELYKEFPIARASENQVYFVSVNAIGHGAHGTAYGHSMIASPEAFKVWEAGRSESFCTLTLDLELVKTCMEYGTYYKDQLINHLGHFNPPMPYAGRISEAPVYKKQRS